MSIRSAFAALIAVTVGTVAPTPIAEAAATGAAIIAGDSESFIVFQSETKTKEFKLKDFNVSLQQFDRNGNATGGKLMVNETKLGNSISPTGAYVGNGYYVLAWVESRRPDGLGIIKARVFDSSTHKLGPVVALSPETLQADSPVLVSDPQGSSLLVFSYLQRSNRVRATACRVLGPTLNPLSPISPIDGLDVTSEYIRRTITTSDSGVWSIPQYQFKRGCVVVVRRTNPSDFGPLECKPIQTPDRSLLLGAAWGSYQSKEDAVAFLITARSSGGFRPNDPSQMVNPKPGAIISGTMSAYSRASARTIVYECSGRMLRQQDFQESASSLSACTYLYFGGPHGVILAIPHKQSKADSPTSILCIADVFAAKPKLAEIIMPKTGSRLDLAVPLYTSTEKSEPTSIAVLWSDSDQSPPAGNIGVFPVVWREMRTATD